ncbi:MAG: glycosyltransferase family 2 protein [Firmicutes bacterium]|nr:glycosyltransferase family 2 protein [Bacillota bacterium]
MKVTAIVPAYNEEATIGTVLRVLTDCPNVDEVIVVSDGSTDNTAAISRNYAVNVIELNENVGKGGALKIGAERTDADVLLFIDADLVGLNPGHIEKLLAPVLEEEADMTVGIFEDGRFATDLAQKIAPFLSGQRAIKRELFMQVPEVEHSRYGIEVALSRYADSNHKVVTMVHLSDLSQVMKEEKQGFVKGFCARMKMYWEIIREMHVR